MQTDRKTKRPIFPPKIISFLLLLGISWKMLDNYHLAERSYLEITFLRTTFLPTTSLALQAPPTHPNLITRSKMPLVQQTPNGSRSRQSMYETRRYSSAVCPHNRNTKSHGWYRAQPKCFRGNYLGENWTTISHQNWLTGRADKDPEVSSYPRETCFHSIPFLPLGFWHHGLHEHGYFFTWVVC